MDGAEAGETGEREWDCLLGFLIVSCSSSREIDRRRFFGEGERGNEPDDADNDRDVRCLVALSCGRTMTKRRAVGRSR